MNRPQNVPFGRESGICRELRIRSDVDSRGEVIERRRFGHDHVLVRPSLEIVPILRNVLRERIDAKKDIRELPDGSARGIN